MRQAASILMSLTFVSCAPPPTDEDMTTLAAEAAADAAAPATADGAGVDGWQYEERVDEMRDATTKTAVLTASDPINLDFPYGQSYPRLIVRQDAKYGFDIILQANGQFLCRSYQGDTLSVKFDDGPIQTWPCNEADAGTSDIVFFNREQSFLSQLRGSRRLIVEAEMYNAGRQQMKFDTAGLRWP